MAKRPVYGLPYNNGAAQVTSHDAEINRCLAAVWDAAVVANLGDAEAAALVDEFRDLWDDMGGWAGQTREDADDIRSRLSPPLVVMALGQSNMRSVTGQTGGDLSVNPNVYAWNSQASPMTNGTGWVVATPGQAPFVGNAGVNNLAFQFCKELQRRTGRKVYLILAALGSHHITAFMNSVDLANNGWAQVPGEADLFTFVMDQLAAALPLVPGAPASADYLIWHQGEADKEDQVEVYARKLRTVLKRFEFNGRIVRNATDIIAGELLVSEKTGRFQARHAAALRRLQMGTRGDAFPRFKIASSDGLQPVDLNDDLHFSGQDLDALAKRYVDAAFMDQKPVELDPTTADLSVDGGLGWATGLVSSQNQRTYARREPYALSRTPLTIENNAELGWCYVSPPHTTTRIFTRKMLPISPTRRLVVDLDIRNDHPSATAVVQVGCHAFRQDLIQWGTALPASDISVPAGTTQRVSVSMGLHGLGADVGITNLAARFAPFITCTPSGRGPAIRFNVLAMRWI